MRWRAINGWGRYEVSDCGYVRNTKTGRILRTSDSGSGHQRVQLYRGGVRLQFAVHRLVLEAFVGDCPYGMEACHENGDPTDNRVENLRWDTHAENMRDRSKHGRSNRGERCHSSKLSAAQVYAIREDPRPQKEIAADYGIARPSVSLIKSRKNWGWLPEKNHDEIKT